MIARDALSVYLAKHLACSAINDYAPNGLQIEGRSDIKRLCTAVSINQAVITAAKAWQADAILVHHGFFWRGEPAVITGIRRQRIGALLNDNISLFAYHLPLDVHLELGNNACIAARLKVEDVTQHDVDKLRKGLWAGQLPQVISPQTFSKTLQGVFKQSPMHIAAQTRTIQRIAWCSGAAQDFIEMAHQLGADAYISGEISERTYDLARELNIHYYACGHHATERYGVQALGQHLEQVFGIEHTFIDSDNPI
jgi:dinuclear metal center YbgI/SA1388 family protein